MSIRFLLALVAITNYLARAEQTKPRTPLTRGVESRLEMRDKLDAAKSTSDIQEKDGLIDEVRALNEDFIASSLTPGSDQLNHLTRKSQQLLSAPSDGTNRQTFNPEPDSQIDVVQTIFGTFVADYHPQVAPGEPSQIKVAFSATGFDLKKFPDLEISVGRESELPACLRSKKLMVKFGAASRSYSPITPIKVVRDSSIEWIWDFAPSEDFKGAKFDLYMNASRNKHTIPVATLPIEISRPLEKTLVDELRTEFAKSTVTVVLTVALPSLASFLFGYFLRVKSRKAQSRIQVVPA